MKPIFGTIVALALFAGAACKDSPATAQTLPPAGEAQAQKEKPATPAAGSWKVGDPIDVLWQESWWQAKILEVKDKESYKVHYVGYSDRWDEVVPATRIRARQADTKRGAGPD